MAPQANKNDNTYQYNTSTSEPTQQGSRYEQHEEQLIHITKGAFTNDVI